jgi:hypothetical protein
VSVDLCRQHASRHCFFFFSSSFVRSFFLQSVLGRVVAGGLEFRFREIRLPECVDFSFSRLLSLSLLLLLLWVLPTPPFLGGWSYCLVRIYRLSKSLFILFYFILSAPCEEEEEEEEEEPL